MTLWTASLRSAGSVFLFAQNFASRLQVRIVGDPDLRIGVRERKLSDTGLRVLVEDVCRNARLFQQFAQQVGFRQAGCAAQSAHGVRTAEAARAGREA